MPAYAKAIAALILVAALVYGGTTLNQEWTCDGYEEDYLNAIASVTGANAIAAAANTQQADAMVREMKERHWSNAEVALDNLASECGIRAMETANRKGQEQILLGL